MEKITKSKSADLKPLVLYFEDVVKICEILSELSAEISIKTENYILENIEELKELGEKVIYHLEISVHNPYVSVDLRPSSARIYISEDNATQRGILDKIKQHLESKQRKLAWLANNSMLAGATLGASTWFFMFGILGKDQNFIIYGVLVALLGAFWSFYGHRNQFRYFTIIFTSSKNDVSNFFTRKKDDIMVALISGAIGALITYLLTK